jgi:hypothetical protein
MPSPRLRFPSMGPSASSCGRRPWSWEAMMQVSVCALRSPVRTCAYEPWQKRGRYTQPLARTVLATALRVQQRSACMPCTHLSLHATHTPIAAVGCPSRFCVSYLAPTLAGGRSKDAKTSKADGWQAEVATLREEKKQVAGEKRQLQARELLLFKRDAAEQPLTLVLAGTRVRCVALAKLCSAGHRILPDHVCTVHTVPHTPCTCTCSP